MLPQQAWTSCSGVSEALPQGPLGKAKCRRTLGSHPAALTAPPPGQLGFHLLYGFGALRELCTERVLLSREMGNPAVPDRTPSQRNSGFSV